MKETIIKNKKALIEAATGNRDREARRLVLDALESALKSANPRVILRRLITLEDNTLKVDDLSLDLGSGEIYVIGGGKGSGAMAEALEEILGDRISAGIVNVLKGTRDTFRTKAIELNEGAHPIPDHRGMEGTEKMLELAREAKREDILICIISGGGSALMPLPKKGVTLEQKQEVNEALLKCGATINEFNAVRKHLSDFKGGQLAQEGRDKRILSLILSDVVGDPLDVIASGPTAPDTSTFSDAVEVLRNYGLFRRTPKAVREVLLRGEKGEIPETPKPGDTIFNKVNNLVVGNNRMVALKACESLRNNGLNTFLLSSFIEGEARHVGRVFAGIAQEEALYDTPLPKPAAVVGGGETTVMVTGQGRGGRNQELVLSACRKMSGLDGVALASIGTDGVDGVTDAAGAIVDGRTYRWASEKGHLPTRYLRDNDSYGFFERVGGAIKTGPTATNLNDLIILVAL